MTKLLSHWWVMSLQNLYGPTEAAIDVTFWHCQPDTPIIPIGKPIANTQIHLLDQYQQPVPICIQGELHFSGLGLARGYLNQPELTQKAFIVAPTPNSNSLTRLYKTGDLARYCPNGEIEYLGRLDYQVKLRGFRIELGEIEIALRQHEAIKEAVVILHVDQANDQRLIAYLVLNNRQHSLPDCRRFLKTHKPDYSVSRSHDVQLYQENQIAK